MKILITASILIFSLVMGQCSGSDDGSESEVILDKLSQKEKEINDFITANKCGPDGCGYMAFGSKPCGGPWKYIVFPNSIDKAKLTKMVDAYNELQHRYNLETNAVSDCMAVMPPEEVACVNGVCTIVK
jgi:hypothetical protein